MGAARTSGGRASKSEGQISLACGPGRRAEKIAAAFGLTTVPAQAGDTSKMQVEFCRVNDAQRIWGLKRGLVYRKIKDRTIRSLNLRERGRKFGVRLLLVESIRSWLMSELEAQEAHATVGK
jgi:hypothetical protein